MLFTSAVLAFILLTHTRLVLAATPSCTTQLGSTSKSPVPTSTKTSTVTTTLIESVVHVTTTASSGTTTILTPKGFTPILSETTSVPPGFPDVAAAAINAKSSPISYPVAVLCSTTTTVTVTKTTTKGRAATTITSTTTLNVPAATFYAACDADNIVDQGKGSGAGRAIRFETFAHSNYTTTEIVNSTAYDCCVACQTTYPCAFSSLFTFYGFDPPMEPVCSLMADGGGACDGSRSIGPAEYFFDPADPTKEPGQGFIVSNGACGQIVYGGAF